MLDPVGGDDRRTDGRRRTLGQLHELDDKPPAYLRGSWKQDLHRLVDAGLDSRRPSDDERAHPTRELTVQYEERNATEVITMQVRRRGPPYRRG